jgi:hypothetical protein
MKYSYSEIKKILFEEVELTPEEINLSLALDMMHEIIRRKRAEGDYDSYKVAKFVASLYGNVDPDELYDEWEEEEALEHQDDYPDASEENDVPGSIEEASFLSRYKEALEMLDDLVKKNLGDDGVLHQTVEFYAMRVARQIPMIDPKKLAQKYTRFYNPVFESSLFEKLNPKDDVSVWIKDFQESDAPQFKEKSKEKRRKMAIAAWTSAKEDLKEAISDDEFDKTLAKLLDTRLGDDLLDAIEKKDRKGIEKILDVEIDNKKKAKEIVKRILS